MNRILRSFLAVLMVLLSSSTVSAIQIDISSFGAQAQTTTFDGLGLMTFDNVAPLEVDGHVISTDDGIFRYSAFPGSVGPECVQNECIGTNTDQGFFDILLDGFQPRAGAWVDTRVGGSIEALFYDLDDVLVGSISYTVEHVFQQPFFGWEHAGGIGRIRFNDLSDNNYVITLDNLIVAVPAPAAVWLLGSALGLLGLTRREIWGQSGISRRDRLLFG